MEYFTESVISLCVTLAGDRRSFVVFLDEQKKSKKTGKKIFNEKRKDLLPDKLKHQIEQKPVH